MMRECKVSAEALHRCMAAKPKVGKAPKSSVSRRGTGGHGPVGLAFADACYNDRSTIYFPRSSRGRGTTSGDDAATRWQSRKNWITDQCITRHPTLSLYNANAYKTAFPRYLSIIFCILSINALF